MSSIIGDVPWLQFGDFNVVRQMSERLVGFDSNFALEFNSCLDDIEMEDMTFKGMLFTWSNKRGGMGHIKSKLDRVLINGSWLDTFLESDTTFLAPGISDHSFILVNVLPEVQKRRPFKFFSFWMRHISFKEILKNSWLSPVDCFVRSKLYVKLSRLKPVLRDLNKEFFSGISSRLAHAREELTLIQTHCS